MLGTYSYSRKRVELSSRTTVFYWVYMLPHPSKSNRNYHPATEVDDRMYGLTSEQRELRRAVSKFAQEKLAPHAGRIDKDNKFNDLRNFWKKLGSPGLHGITAPEKYGVDGRPYLPDAFQSCPIWRNDYGPQGRQNIPWVPAIHRPISKSVEQDERDDLRWVQVWQYW